MSISSALSNALTGMKASSKRAEVTSNNIANAANEGYARQSVETVSRLNGGRSDGVSVTPVERASDQRLTSNRRIADAEAGGDRSLATAGRTIADAVGDVDDANSLFNRIAALENSFRGISETPESVAFQERAAAAAGDVVNSFNTISSTIQTVRSDADADIARGVDVVNAKLQEVATLNKEISTAVVGGRTYAGYQQQRSEALDVIGEYIPIRTIARDNGGVSVLTDTGITLVDHTAKTLEFTDTPIVAPNFDKRNGLGPLSGLTVDGRDISPGASTQSLRSGTLAGLFEVRDGTATKAIAELDVLAEDLATRFQAAGIAGADGRGIFTDAGAVVGATPDTGLAARLSLNEQVDPSNGGVASRFRDGLDAVTPGSASRTDFARALIDAMTEARAPGGSLSTPRSASGLAGDLGSLFERRGQNYEDTAAGSKARSAVLLDAEISFVGVDVDRELQELILIEQSYAANARVIEVSDRLIQRLLEI